MSEERLKYMTDFLWPHSPGTLEELLYEFANCKTEEYRKETYKKIKELFGQPREIDEEKVLKMMFDYRVDYGGTNIPYENIKPLSKAICLAHREGKLFKEGE